jgi:peptidoglycan/LPS O-acetylase OafA/YrhL
MVFLHHYNPFDRQVWGILSAGVEELHVGVTVFFVLSGFLIMHRYFERKDFSLRTYFVNRVARIYPMYLLLTVLTFALLYFSGKAGADLLTFVLNITFLRGFFDDYKWSGIGQGWSLTTEETFYLLAPLFFLLIRRSKTFLLVLPVLLLLTGAVLVMVLGGMNWHGLFRSYSFMLDYTFFGRCCEFFVGMALALILRRGIRMKRGPFFTYTGIAGMLFCVYLMTLCRGMDVGGVEDLPNKMINTLLLPVAGIGLFFAGLLTERTLVSRVLESRLMVVAGKSSYVFYLLHAGVVAGFIQSVLPNPLVFLVAIGLLSHALFRYVEEPLNRVIRGGVVDSLRQ